MIGLELGYRLASLADGEGCFSIRKSGRAKDNGFNCSPSFIVKMRFDDAPFLERMHREVGLGRVNYIRAQNYPGRVNNPAIQWSVTRLAHCRELVDIFDEYPLWSKKKADYDIWRELVLLMSGPGVQRHQQMEAYHALRAVRVYQEPEVRDARFPSV